MTRLVAAAAAVLLTGAVLGLVAEVAPTGVDSGVDVVATMLPPLTGAATVAESLLVVIPAAGVVTVFVVTRLGGFTSPPPCEWCPPE
jgi:hypothetical protein